MLKGKIIKNISNIYTVLSGDKIYNCKPRGKFRKDSLTPLVGDFVEFDEVNNYLLKILERKNELDRPSICNIDVAVIVTSLRLPDLSLNLLDKEITSILLANIKPVICFTKLDLIDNEMEDLLEHLAKYYKSIGIDVYMNNNLDPFIQDLKGKYIVLTGQTGAGKSSLINRLDSTKNILEGEVSLALGRGKHTTRHTEFHEVKGVYIADTPGFSSLDLKKYSKEEIRDSFREFANFTCEYRDCMHINEAVCGVKEAIKNGDVLESRYDNYVNFLK